MFGKFLEHSNLYLHDFKVIVESVPGLVFLAVWWIR